MAYSAPAAAFSVAPTVVPPQKGVSPPSVQPTKTGNPNSAPWHKPIANGSFWKLPSTAVITGEANRCSANRARGSRSTVRASSSTQAESVHTESAEAERAELKAKLFEDLEKTSGNLTETSQGLIAALEKLNPTPAPTASRDNFVASFLMLNSTTQNVLYKGATVTAGRLTFNVLKPTDLKVTMEDVYNYVGLETEDAYNVEIQFTVQENDGLPPVRGKLLNRAKFQVASPQRLDITFLSSTLVPQDPETDLQDWLKVFKEANPEMDENGSLVKQLPPGLQGWIDQTYMDDEIRINRGNLGNIVVLKRLPTSGR